MRAGGWYRDDAPARYTHGVTTPSTSSPAAGPVVSARRLIGWLADPELRVVDARFELLDPAAGATLYASSHVPGAVRLDLESDLAGDPRGGGGRHPLPDMAAFAAALGARGIGRGHRVVVYDQEGGMYAARAWWLLRYAGHEDVYVLDGGMAAYRAADGPETRDPPSHAPVTFELEVRPGMVATLEEVVRRHTDPDLVLLDARAPERYRGEVEPLDKRAGHIPGALNRPYTTALRDGLLLPPAALADALDAAALAQRDVVAYCGSGVSAAHLILALERAGCTGVRLYPGSWSEWSSDPERPIATGGGAAE